MMAARKEAKPAMNKDEDYICFYRNEVIAGHDAPAAETMRRFNLTHDYTVRLLNEAIARCDGQDIRNWNRRNEVARAASAIEDASGLGRLNSSCRATAWRCGSSH